MDHNKDRLHEWGSKADARVAGGSTMWNGIWSFVVRDCSPRVKTNIGEYFSHSAKNSIISTIYKRMSANLMASACMLDWALHVTRF